MPNPVCWQNHMGPWALEETYFREAVLAVQRGLWQPRAAMSRFPRVELQGPVVGAEVRLARPAPAPRADVIMLEDPEPDDPYGAGYVVTEGGVAIVELLGPLMKARSKFGGTSTVGVQRALRAALADQAVSAIMLHIESPGGSVAGTPELADAVAAADKVKPVHAFIEDLGASAAVWVGFQARRVTANAAAQVGSIGAFCVLEDVSKMYEAAGVKVHVLATGPEKGVGVPGTPLTDAAQAPFREYVNHAGAMFFEAVRKGRSLTEKRLDAVVSGRTWPAPAALELHLLDAVEAWPAALEAAAAAGAKAGKASAARPPRNRAKAAVLAARLVRVRAGAVGGAPRAQGPAGRP